MNPIVYVFIWAILLIFPIITAMKKRWIAFVLYVAGCLAMLYNQLRPTDGWEDLSNLAMLGVVVVPVYVVASIVWLVTALMSVRKGTRS
ncbi:hypothetical protein [Paenibacillus koleovorans]|uniref:hypothetical protein n=1 Tax=Paenibacillus koleovorans TaxID=121608 RepID=UPI000FD79AF2|nr:hypothetical protein [Paenibacillus koleovorans]